MELPTVQKDQIKIEQSKPDQSLKVVQDLKNEDNPLKLKVKRTPTIAELEGLERAFEAVEKQGQRFKEEGLNIWSFQFSIFNLVFTGFLLGRYPEYYWIYQLIKVIIMLIYMVKLRVQKKEILYFCEFCWFMIYLFVIWGILKVLKINGITTPVSDIKNITQNVFLMSWAIANGPLSFAAVIFNNMLVLHSLEQTASLYIHFTPLCVVWSLRWSAEKVHDRWGDGIFGCPINEAAADKISFVNIMGPAIVLYIIWWIYYLIWITFHGRYQSPETTGYNMLFHWNMRKQKGLAKLLKYDTENPTKMGPIVKLHLGHMIFSFLAFSWAAFLFHHYWLHTIYVALVFYYVTYLGSIRYYKMMTRYYQKQIKRLVKQVEDRQK